MSPPMRSTAIPLLLLVALAGCPAHRTVRVNGTDLSVDDAAREDLEAARARLGAGEPAQAAEMFEQVALRYPDSVEADEALFGAGQAWEKAGETLKARAAYERLLHDHPDSDKVAVAQERIATMGGPR